MSRDELKLVSRDGGTEHAFTQENLPWLANGLLCDADRERVDAHLAQCAGCRATADREAKLRSLFEPQGGVDLAPQPGLAAVIDRIDARERRRAPLGALRSILSGVGGQRPLVFAVAIQSLVIVMLTSVLAFALWTPAPVYRTLTTPPDSSPAAARVQLRVVFADDLTMGELQALLLPNGLRILAGPGDRGIYTLGLEGSVEPALAALRANPGVRLAEPVGAP